MADLKAPEKAFVRRCVALADEQDKLAKMPIASVEGPMVQYTQSQGSISSTQPQVFASMQELMGSEQSALTVATAIAAGDAKPDVAKLLMDAGLQYAEDAFA